MSDNIQARLDKWLWHARFFRTRGLAQKACDSRRMRLNGARVSKAHQRIRPGDVLTFTQARQVRVVRVLAVAEKRGAACEAATLYEDLDSDTTNVPMTARHI